MEEVFQTQIRDGCRLAWPEGLRDLMSDISREVLRAQPSDLYQFIVDYLEAMLLARDTLCVACKVCRDVCSCVCHPELEEELRNIGLNEDDLETAMNVVKEFFEKDEVKEETLITKLFYNTNVDPDLLADIQVAVRTAFQKHLQHHQAEYWAEAEKTNGTGQRAARNTLEFYDRAQRDKELSWEGAATKIQANVRGNLIKVPLDDAALRLRGKLAQVESSGTSPRPVMKSKDEPDRPSTSKPGRNNVLRLSLSSTSLAGSLINLPKYIPYSVHDLTYADFEERETERKNIDYTEDTLLFKDSNREDSKKIAFFEQHVLHEIKSCSDEEGDIEEQIAEDVQSEPASVDENINIDETDEEFGRDFDEVVDQKLSFKNIIPESTDTNKDDYEESNGDKTYLQDSDVDIVNEEKLPENNFLSDEAGVSGTSLVRQRTPSRTESVDSSKVDLSMMSNLKIKLMSHSNMTITKKNKEEENKKTLNTQAKQNEDVHRSDLSSSE